MKPGIRPGTEKRTALLKWCTERDMPASTLLKKVEPMRGKTEEEKEKISEALLKQLADAPYPIDNVTILQMIENNTFDEALAENHLAGVDLNTPICDLKGFSTTYLYEAVNHNNLPAVSFLLENGADPNVAISDGEPPIWGLQYKYDNPEYGLQITKLLLDYGADPNIKWETEGFYTYVDTKDVVLIQSKEELDYLMNLADLLEKYGGKYDWEK